MKFLVFSEESKLNKEKQKREKTIYTGNLPTNKRRTRNHFGFSFNATTNLNWKENKNQVRNIFGFSQSF